MHCSHRKAISFTRSRHGADRVGQPACLLALIAVALGLAGVTGCGESSLDAAVSAKAGAPTAQASAAASGEAGAREAGTGDAVTGEVEAGEVGELPCCKKGEDCEDDEQAGESSGDDAAQPADGDDDAGDTGDDAAGGGDEPGTAQASLDRSADERVKVITGEAAPHKASDGATGASRVSDWIEPDDRQAFYLDFDAMDQDGRSLNLTSLTGKPMVVSFIFTRCPRPDMCPLITLQVADLQRRVDRAGLGDRVRMVLVTYDPAYDTPERLRAFGASRGLRFTNALMIRPEADRFMELLDEFQVGADYRPDGSIGHFIELILIDAKGRFVRDYLGGIWDNNQVLADLTALADESAGDASKAQP